jgi:hypothetical protein
MHFQHTLLNNQQLDFYIMSSNSQSNISDASHRRERKGLRCAHQPWKLSGALHGFN